MSVTSVVSIEIRAPQALVATLWADPSNNPKWMDDIDRVEPLSGELGMPGSTYRLVPKKGDMVFTATEVSRDLPNEGRLNLDSRHVAVAVTDTFRAAGSDRTQLVSHEVFSFKSFLRGLFGTLAQRRIRKAHEKHMDSFRQFAESCASR